MSRRCPEARSTGSKITARHPSGRGRALVRSLISFIFLALFPGISLSDQLVRVAVYQGAGESLGGFARDALKIVARDNGWQLAYLAATGPEALTGLESGEIDLVLNVPYSDPYKHRFRLSNLSLFDNWTEIYTVRGSALDSPLDLRGKRIGVPENSSQSQAARNILSDFQLEAEFVSFSTSVRAAEALAQRKIDAAAMDHAFSLNGAQAFEIEKMPYSSTPYGLRVAASDDSMSPLLAVIDSYIFQGRKDGSTSYYAAYDKWFPRDRKYHLPGYIYWLTVVVATFLLAFYIGRLFMRGVERRKVVELEERSRKLEVDAREHEVAQKHLHQLAYYDEISSLPNRLMFNEKLHAAMIEEKGSVSVAIVDLDRFKSFNDTLGHEAGNALLRLVSKRIAAALPEDVLFARYGGDEFSMLITGASPEGCAGIAEKVVNALKEPVTELGSELYVTASIGLSHYPTEAQNIPELFQQADIAMYRAKVEGGNTYCLYDAEFGNSIVSRMELETGMRRALARGEMWLEYQPQVDLETNKILAVEALLRWRHPERGLMDTSEFIQVAEETGQIITIGEWVMEEVFAQAAQWREQDVAPFRIAINLSSKQTQKRDFVPFVRQLMEEYDFPPEVLELEITEHMLIEHENDTRRTMHELKDLGMSLAIDNFGTGYSALSYLHRFPVDTLKIDKSLVESLHSNDSNRAITSAIVAMAERLDLRTVAECVEKREQVAILGEMHCQAAQGNYFAEPLTQEKLAEWLKSRSKQE